MVKHAHRMLEINIALPMAKTEQVGTVCGAKYLLIITLAMAITMHSVLAVAVAAVCSPT